ncbi:MAG: efflux RND transporter periplasmic adaptor subunit, partial [Gammaproteobacteria bacterium]|nr:efflux RND transporter periplasmic adaptor subunit [Gammaproteobacteria bacterium]
TVTATITATQHHAVLLVPNTALRYEPLSANEAKPAAAGSLVSRLTPRMPARRARTPAAVTARSTTARRVWVLSDGIAVPVPVTPGISDGRVTEIVAGDLRAGQAVIVDQKVAAAK